MSTYKLLAGVGLVGALLLGAATDASANRWHGPHSRPVRVYRAPVYRAPVHRAPVVYAAPVVYSPAYVPVYRAPVYAPVHRGDCRHGGSHIRHW